MNEEKIYIDLRGEAIKYAYELMQSKDKSPEMVAAISRLVDVILNGN